MSKMDYLIREKERDWSDRDHKTKMDYLIREKETENNFKNSETYFPIFYLFHTIFLFFFN